MSTNSIDFWGCHWSIAFDSDPFGAYNLESKEKAFSTGMGILLHSYIYFSPHLSKGERNIKEEKKGANHNSLPYAKNCQFFRVQTNGGEEIWWCQLHSTDWTFEVPKASHNGHAHATLFI